MHLLVTKSTPIIANLAISLLSHGPPMANASPLAAVTAPCRFGRPSEKKNFNQIYGPIYRPPGAVFPMSAHRITRRIAHTPLAVMGNVRHAHLPGAIVVQIAPLPPEAGEPTHRVRMTSR